MQDEADLCRFIAGQPDMMALLEVAGTVLPDALIAAGFVRNAVWDALHGRLVDCAGLNDVDVIYLAAEESASREQTIEQLLREARPDVPWSVKNQARMHTRNGDLPYRDCAHAMSHWPETATAIGVRLKAGQLELVAPLGVHDLLNLVVRPTIRFQSKRAEYDARQRAKGWQTRWPRLTFAAV